MTNSFPSFSVLMSVYYKENPIFLEQAINSILENSVLPNEIVIVKDGTLTPELEKVLNAFDNSVIKVIGYDENKGLGYALNFGLKYCSNDLVARMDSDDICSSTRFEKELLQFIKNQDLSIVGSNISEFIGCLENIVSIRSVPQDIEDIIKYSKKRNPFNHPSVMFKKSDVVSAGGYVDFYRHEDYYLWYRMLKKGCLGFNIQECLVNMRTTEDFYKRRGGWKTFINRMKLSKIMLNDHYISLFTYLMVFFLNFSNTIIPSFVRKTIHRKFLRSKRK